MLEDATDVTKAILRSKASNRISNSKQVNEYFFNSEGTVLRSGRNLYQMHLSCSTQAPDAMSLELNHGFVRSNIKELPSAAEFEDRARKLAGRLGDLHNAPVVDEEYRGPMWLSARASTSVFADLVGENVLGRCPELGKNALTTGAFATSYKSRVLPDSRSVVSDPTMSSYQGQSLLGHHEIDDEGVPAQRVSLIEKGILLNYLIGREPIRDFPRSNGHGRAPLPGIAPRLAGSALPHNSNLIVTSSEPLDQDALKTKSVDLCRQRDFPYCYRVETFGPKLIPRLLYRVWAKAGVMLFDSERHAADPYTPFFQSESLPLFRRMVSEPSELVRSWHAQRTGRRTPLTSNSARSLICFPSMPFGRISEH